MSGTNTATTPGTATGTPGGTTSVAPQPGVATVSTPAGEQWRGLERGWVWFELAGRTQLVVTGRDRQKFLHNFCTNDIKGLGPNRGCEAFVTTIQGKLLAQVTAWNGPEELALLGPPGQGPRLLKHLMKYHMNEELELADVTDRRASLLLTGPGAERGCAELGLTSLPAESRTQQAGVFQGHPLWVRREEWLGRTTWELTIAVEGREALRKAVADGGVAAGPELFEWLRIEAGCPWHGVDLDEGNLAQEASRTAQAIHFRKGCYLGQEPIARIDALGHVNQQIRRLVVEGVDLPAAGAELRTEEEVPRAAGRVTSVARHPAGAGVKALALVRRGWEQPGTRLQVACGTGWRPARVEWTEPAS
ncbi:MAG: YgfZ/GcvT domain-containing protein [Planctomycetaceae bacterium]